MKERFNALNIYHQTFVLSVIFSIIIFILMIPLIIFNYMEIPLGLVLGEVVSFTSYFIIGFIDKRKALDKKTNRLIVSVLIIRLLVLVIVSTLTAIIYYKFNYHIFNVIAITGGYLIPLIIFIVSALLERKRG